MLKHSKHISSMPNLASLSHGPKTLFITGATGALGASVLPRLLKRHPEAQFVLLIRAVDTAELISKLDSLYAFCEISDADHNRIYAAHGDVTADLLGMAQTDYLALARSVTDVFHLAADLRFDLSLEQSRLSNVKSTESVLDLVRCAWRSGQFHRLNYVSTAYISGDWGGAFREAELNNGQGFFNTYEQSKMEAELLVEQFKSEAPTTIYRPSMIIGEAGTGKIRSFFGLYEFLKLADMGRISMIPAEPTARPDLIPVDYVADAIVFLAEFPRACSQTYHLTAGLARSLPISEVVATIWKTSIFERVPKLPEVIPYHRFAAMAGGQALQSRDVGSLNMLLRTYMPYLAFERRFEVDSTASLLACHGISMPSLKYVLPVICKYAKDKGFGIHRKQASS